MRNDSEFEHVYAVILAGGSGTRFWPLSRRSRPKQLLKLFGRDTLLEQTVARIRAIIRPEHTYVFTSAQLRGAVSRLLPKIPKSQIVGEPAARNTAPTLGLAAHEISRRDANGIMVVLPSDHLITKTRAFLAALRAACRWASAEGRSVVLGIEPTRPDTGFGYVRLGPVAARLQGQKIFRVQRFTEKPPLSQARRFLRSRRYVWNGGMFIWKAATLLRNLETYQPGMARLLKRIARVGGIRSGATLRWLFPRIKKISIDYALMENIHNVFAVAADIGWSDVGSWAVVYDLERKSADGNVRPTASLCFDSKGNLIVSEKKFVLTVGAHNMVVVETDDALLVCARERSQGVGKAVQELERRGLRKLL